jgi:hypothetical protein
VALAGDTVADNCCVPLIINMAEDGLTDTPVTATGLTVTIQFAVLFPSSVVTVIVAVPTDIAFTSPPVLTDTTAVLLLLHITFLLEALAGDIVADNCCVAFTIKEAEIGFTDTPVTGTGFTVTTQFAVLFPSCVVTVIVAVPTALAVTSPLALTVATELLLVLHITFLLEALAGDIVADNCCVAFTIKEAEIGFTDTPVTATGLTVTTQFAVLFPSSVVMVIVAVPTEFAVTSPLALTVATAVLLLLQLIF